ncbi:putative RNA methyltransferase [Frankia sp. BMG5.23]|uniref:putative RNA methyltransferase n=1 Tax=Frankia sp. BMG5.23 TaxID=683305 RepID=UPI0004611E47|nr:methyltransferase domain-containing protein [Frankia sp. BMG5.23]KDA44904.1 23S rRNA m(1)G-748 methyltransferase [Frankia sp. BMG5.23]
MLPFLRCPVCGHALHPADRSLRCPAGHDFDVGRGGYVNLRTGRTRRVVGDSAVMVAARESFLGGGHYGPLTARLAQIAHPVPGGPSGLSGPFGPPGRVILDIGAGTGHHLAGVVGARPDAVGLAVDVSKYALRRAARAHPRIGAVSFDVAAPWPVADHAVAVLLDVFAPRNLAQMHRVLRPDGLLIVVTPGPGHLAELYGPLGLVGIQAGKSDRLDERTTGRFEPIIVEHVDVPLTLNTEQIVDLALMGPTGHHRAPDQLRRRAETAFPGSATVTARFQIRGYRPLPVPPVAGGR